MEPSQQSAPADNLPLRAAAADAGFVARLFGDGEQAPTRRR
jgi:hypothetical protein